MRSEKLVNEFVAVNALLDEFNLLSAGARPSSEPSAMEMMTRAAALLDELQKQRPGLPTYFLSVSVESAGGTHRIAHNLLNSLAGSDGISLRAGVVLSYALFNSLGVVVTAGLVPQRSVFEPVSAAAPLRTWIAVIGVLFASILAAAVSLRLSAKLVP